MASKCAKFALILEAKFSSCPQPSSFTPQAAKHIPKFTNLVQLEDEEDEPANEDRTNISPPAHTDSPSVESLGNFNETINVEPPSLAARPMGRKAAKRVKRQASLESHSAIGEKVAKNLDEM
ncbi:hypothetical protein Droror1_Dr00022918 [Drosera rotundifolia]